MGIGPPPRGYALARVGDSITGVTGNPWTLIDGRRLSVPPGTALPQPEGTSDWNDRYYAYVAEWANLPDIEDRIAAVRYKAAPYTSDHTAAAEVLETMRTRGYAIGIDIETDSEGSPVVDVGLYPSDGHGGVDSRRMAVGEATTLPEALAIAALRACGVDVDTDHRAREATSDAGS